MPRPSKGARLWADQKADLWYIRDGTSKRGTGCRIADREGADRALAVYIEEKYEPVRDSRSDIVLVGDVLTFYSRTVVEGHRSNAAAYAILALSAWWGQKPIAEIKASTCKAYVDHRTSQPIAQAKTEEAKKRKVKAETARRELAVLKAALTVYHKETPLQALPVVSMPGPAKARTRFLSRNEAARLLWATRKLEDRDAAQALRRFILLGLYTGTRSGALRGLGWMPNTVGGYIDVRSGVIYRLPDNETESKKRRPSARIPNRLAGSLARWQRIDLHPTQTANRPDPKTNSFVIHYRDQPVLKQRRSWAEAVSLAKLGKDVTPHVLRHTAVTWMMLSGNDPYDVANYVGMSLKMLDEVYGHHHPDHQRDIAARIGRR